MSCRELALVSTAAVFGAPASALTCRFFFSNPKRQSAKLDLSKNGVVSGNALLRAVLTLQSAKAERTKDPNRQVGACLACLVSENGVILGIGYNGFPRGCSDDKLPWAKKSRTGDPLETNEIHLSTAITHMIISNGRASFYVCHAEVNAILNTNHASAAGQRLYVTMFPCNECAKIIIQSGVAEVVYFVEKRLNNQSRCLLHCFPQTTIVGRCESQETSTVHEPNFGQVLGALDFESDFI